jgi:fructose-specific phosphotransferase system IIA component
MNLLDILQPACVKAPLAATDKRAAIDELVDLLTAAGKVSEPQTLKDAVWSREQTRTTGIGHGLAIPHGKCATVNGLAMAIGKPAQPIDFQAIDGRPVRLIILLASPPDRTADHIQALARVSRLLMMEDFRESVYGSGTGEEIFELFRKQETK